MRIITKYEKNFKSSFEGKSDLEILNLSLKFKNQIKMCEFFIEKFYMYVGKYDHYNRSYTLKHQIENYFKVCEHIGVKFKAFDNEMYISNDSLKIAMFNLYFDEKLNCPGPNLVYAFRWKGPKFFNGRLWEMPIKEEDWENVLNVSEVA